MIEFEIPGVFRIDDGTYTNDFQFVAGDVTVTTPSTGQAANITTLPTAVAGNDVNYLVMLTEAESETGSFVSYVDQGGEWLGPRSVITECDGDDPQAEDLCPIKVVRDGGPIEAAIVIVSQGGAPVQAGATNSQGLAFFALDPGSYTVEVLIDGEPSGSGVLNV